MFWHRHKWIKIKEYPFEEETFKEGDYPLQTEWDSLYYPVYTTVEGNFTITHYYYRTSGIKILYECEGCGEPLIEKIVTKKKLIKEKEVEK
jgi:hypothetical protein